MPTADEVKGWDTARVVEFAQGLKLSTKAVCVLEENEVNGESLVNLTKEDLLRAGMMMGPATILAAAIAELPRNTFTLMLKCGGNGKRGVLVPHTFTSSEDFAKFATGNHIYVSSKDGLKKRAVRSLPDAQKLASGDFLMLSTPFDVIDERVSTLEGNMKNTSTGQEHATTQAIAHCETMRTQFGELHVINDGYPVVFYNEKGEKALEADGLVVNSVVLLLNEVKHTPKLEDADAQQGHARTLGRILAAYRKKASSYSSEPADCLPELARAGITSVRPVLSGYNFDPSVEAACVENGVLVMKTNGSDYSNTA